MIGYDKAVDNGTYRRVDGSATIGERLTRNNSYALEVAETYSRAAMHDHPCFDRSIPYTVVRQYRLQSSA